MAKPTRSRRFNQSLATEPPVLQPNGQIGPKIATSMELTLFCLGWICVAVIACMTRVRSAESSPEFESRETTRGSAFRNPTYQVSDKPVCRRVYDVARKLSDAARRHERGVISADEMNAVLRNETSRLLVLSVGEAACEEIPRNQVHHGRPAPGIHQIPPGSPQGRASGSASISRQERPSEYELDAAS